MKPVDLPTAWRLARRTERMNPSVIREILKLTEQPGIISMAASALVYLIGTPLALGSYWGFLGLAAMLPALIWRLLDEERLLARDLSGYADYMRKVKHRLVPFIW